VVLTCLIAAALAIGFAQLLLPIFPLPITYTLGAYAALPLIGVVVGVLASLAGVRRAVRTDPALAFAGRDSRHAESRRWTPTKSLPTRSTRPRVQSIITPAES
jgi:hypothetical protein